MPIYEFRCEDGHVTERLRTYDTRTEPSICRHCAKHAERIEISRTHVEPDGIYSYAPNIGTASRFERQQHAIKNNIKIIPRED